MPHRVLSRQAPGEPQSPAVAGRATLARNLKKWRAARNLTQARLAKLTGLNNTFLSLLENTHRTVSLDNICRIAAALRIHPRRLFDEEEDEEH